MNNVHSWKSADDQLSLLMLALTHTMCPSLSLPLLQAMGVEIVLPTDVIVADKFAPDANTQVVDVNAIPDGWMVSGRTWLAACCLPCPALPCRYACCAVLRHWSRACWCSLRAGAAFSLHNMMGCWQLCKLPAYPQG
jgi:hypothetical protein